jgi:hypothetical protein
MTSLYGSKANPKKQFGEDTPELNAFYEAMYKLCPGACQLLDALVNSWNPYTLTHEWQLPDGFDVKVKVKAQKEAKIEIDELNHSTFTYVWYENEGCERDVKNAANVVHSIDGYILRSLVRRCNYDYNRTCILHGFILDELMGRHLGSCTELTEHLTEEVGYYVTLYEQTNMADVVILPYLDRDTLRSLTDDHLKALRNIISSMLEHKPFEVVTIHDDFKCSANNVNWLRKHYRNILAELADSNTLNAILTQLYQQPVTFTKSLPDLSTHIRQSNYALT